MARPERSASGRVDSSARRCTRRRSGGKATFAERTATPNGIAEAIRTSVGKKIRLDAGHGHSRGGICCLHGISVENPSGGTREAVSALLADIQGCLNRYSGSRRRKGARKPSAESVSRDAGVDTACAIAATTAMPRSAALPGSHQPDRTNAGRCGLQGIVARTFGLIFHLDHPHFFRRAARHRPGDGLAFLDPEQRRTYRRQHGDFLRRPIGVFRVHELQ